MCGRFTQMHTWPEVHAFLALEMLQGPVAEALYGERYNIAPSQSIPLARAAGERVAEIVPMRWGLLPGWAKTTQRAPINARAETLASNAMFRSAFKHRRCLIPASGFYEWQALAGSPRKQPWYFHPAEEPLFAFGGVWEPAREGEGALATFAIVTTPANEFVQPIHDRMPLILPRAARQTWLFGSPEEAAALLVPVAGTALAAYRVSERVNSSRAEGSALIEALD